MSDPRSSGGEGGAKPLSWESWQETGDWQPWRQWYCHWPQHYQWNIVFCFTFLSSYLDNRVLFILTQNWALDLLWLHVKHTAHPSGERIEKDRNYRTNLCRNIYVFFFATTITNPLSVNLYERTWRWYRLLLQIYDHRNEQFNPQQMLPVTLQHEAWVKQRKTGRLNCSFTS